MGSTPDNPKKYSLSFFFIYPGWIKKVSKLVTDYLREQKLKMNVELIQVTDDIACE